jgi:hypothetical protein
MQYSTSTAYQRSSTAKAGKGKLNNLDEFYFDEFCDRFKRGPHWALKLQRVGQMIATSPGFNKRFGFFGWHGFREVIPLSVVAVGIFKQHELFRTRNALSHQFHIELLAQADNGLNDVSIFGAVFHTADERAIDFQRIRRKTMQIA